MQTAEWSGGGGDGSGGGGDGGGENGGSGTYRGGDQAGGRAPAAAWADSCLPMLSRCSATQLASTVLGGAALAAGAAENAGVWVP